MKKMFISAEIEKFTDSEGVEKQSTSDARPHLTEGEAVADARKRATKYVGDTYGVFELTGTVVHPVPELDVTPVA